MDKYEFQSEWDKIIELVTRNILKFKYKKIYYRSHKD